MQWSRRHRGRRKRRRRPMETTGMRRTDVEPKYAHDAEPPNGERLQLYVEDPEVVLELRRHAEGAERDRYAVAALRLGVLSLRLANGHLDAGLIRGAGRSFSLTS